MNRVMIERYYDKCCFGVYRAVRSTMHKTYVIRKGGVYVKFRGQWYEVTEGDLVDRNNRLQSLYTNFPPVLELIFH